jgi:hypothetical protein
MALTPQEQEELTRLEILIKELNEKYLDSDILTFADLNVDVKSVKLDKLKKKLKLHNLIILNTPKATGRVKDYNRRTLV